MAVSYQTQRTLDDLSSRFSKATKGIRDNTRKTKLHSWQTDFAYMLNDIAHGPNYIAPKIVDNANKFIDSIIKARREAAEVA